MDDDLDGRIMEAAWHLLADKSLASLTIREIAECAGTSRPAIYRRWNSVEEVAIDDLVVGEIVAGRLGMAADEFSDKR